MMAACSAPVSTKPAVAMVRTRRTMSRVVNPPVRPAWRTPTVTVWSQPTSGAPLTWLMCGTRMPRRAERWSATSISKGNSRAGSPMGTLVSRPSAAAVCGPRTARTSRSCRVASLMGSPRQPLPHTTHWACRSAMTRSSTIDPMASRVGPGSTVRDPSSVLPADTGPRLRTGVSPKALSTTRFRASPKLPWLWL